MRRTLTLVLAATALAVPLAARPQAHDPAAHAGHHGRASASPAPPLPADPRIAVAVPEPLRSHMLANMRDHLLALAEIQQALATLDTERAAQLAEQRLGLSSLQRHGAHDVARHMPQAMQDAGTAMHRRASQFAGIAREAGATGDLKPALASLSQLTQACVGCHAGYRLP